MSLPAAETSSTLPDGTTIDDFEAGPVSTDSYVVDGNEFGLQLVDPIRDAVYDHTSFSLKLRQSGSTVYFNTVRAVFEVDGQVVGETTTNFRSGIWNSVDVTIAPKYGGSNRTHVDAEAPAGSTVTVRIVPDSFDGTLLEASFVVPADPRGPPTGDTEPTESTSSQSSGSTPVMPVIIGLGAAGALVIIS